MIKEVKILLEQGTHKSKNGSVFENLIRLVLESQHYQVIQNVHDAGLEIDLFAQHKVKKELLYVECKAKEKPKSDEIKKFVFAMDYGVDEKKANYGYFVHTEELDRQAATLKLKLENEKDNLSFIGPSELISILEDTGRITAYREVTIKGCAISKLILSYTPEGFHYILILQEGTIASHFTVIDAKSLIPVSSQVNDFLKNGIKELQYLEKIEIKKINNPTKGQERGDIERDVVIPIKESENWYDYTPASYEHFIGRQNLKRDLKSFLERARTSKSNKRIFFLDGKSGWGKSSLLAELKGSSSQLKYWKSRLFVLAVDTRSASTANYIGLAFKKLVSSARSEGFINHNFTSELRISSPLDVLEDESVKELLRYLKHNKKLLVIVFDQFEDQFRKESLFDAFYKFCLDVDEYRENIVVGFSWKSEINIPLGNPAYHKFNQLREFASQITIPEFSQNDAKHIVKQLERTIKKHVGTDLENRLIESSQGYPWLIKKLCIHTYKQFVDGKSIEEIVEQELNYKDLFENDILNLSGEEKKALDYIAKRAYEGNPFEISEFDKINQDLVDLLIHKRLLIRTGSSYNIYWDIFRDYIVTKEIPVIGESYLLRQSGKACLECFLTFKTSNTMSLNEIKVLYPKEVSEYSIQNILLELRSIGLVRKLKEENIYSLTAKVEEVSESFFRTYVTNKLQNYRPLLELSKSEKSSILIEDVVDVLKSIFKTEKLEEATWYAYAKNILLWLDLSDLELKTRVIQVRNRKTSLFKGKSRYSTLKDDATNGRPNIFIKDRYSEIPKYSPTQCIKSYEKFLVEPNLVHAYKFRDLVLLGLVHESEVVIKSLNSLELQRYLADEAIKFSKINMVYNLVRADNSLNIHKLSSKITSIIKTPLSQASKIQNSSILLSWASFIFKVKSGSEIDISSLRERKRNSKFYLSFGPKHVLKTLKTLNNNVLELSRVNIRKLNDLVHLGLVEFKNYDYIPTQISVKVLNSKNPELELCAKLKDIPEFKEFESIYKQCLEKKMSKEDMIIFCKDFFLNYSESSRKFKFGIYSSWVKFLQKDKQQRAMTLFDEF